jgi:hypothetical protein
MLSGVLRAGLDASLQYRDTVLQLLQVDWTAPDRLAGGVCLYRKDLCLPFGKQFCGGRGRFARRINWFYGILAPGWFPDGLLWIGTPIIPVEFQ